MKKILGAAIANWFRKPENREKAKQTAKRAYEGVQRHRASRNPNKPPKR
ncbi:hypothetical protein [Salinicola aestuarinus]|nr:hypothetical protein [Salinicola aestuarinus]